MIWEYTGEIIVVLLAAFAGYNLGKIFKHYKKK